MEPKGMSSFDIMLSQVGHKYRSEGKVVTALDGVDLNIKRGELFAVVGPSGCGKSTLLRIVLGLEQPTAGSVLLNEQREKEGISYIPQSANLLSWRTALQNASIGLELRIGIDKPVLQNLLADFRQYGLQGFETTKWSSLSGGMKQKVAIICAFANRPKILIGDEPFSAIDFVSRLELLNKFKSECSVLGLTAVIVTHNIEEAIFLGDRVAVFSRRPGRVKKVYDIDLGKSGHDSVECRKSAEFQRLFHTIWADLKEP
jgi:NitT/TauT family transport system ATP-binding protein